MRALDFQGKNMGYFDKISELAFKEGDNGETIYFPNGILGKGRLVQDPVRKTKLFKFHKRINKYLIPFFALYGIILGLGGSVSLEGFMPVLIFSIIIFIRQRFLTRGLPVYNGRLTGKEVTASLSKIYHPLVLIFMAVNGVILMIISLGTPFVLDKPISEILVLVVAPFIVGFTLFGFSLYLYKVKKTKNGKRGL